MFHSDHGSQPNNVSPNLGRFVLLDPLVEAAELLPDPLELTIALHIATDRREVLVAYCAARLQTVDEGAAVSTYTVSREMGHGGEAMVRAVYGHLGQVCHRAEAVEYRIEQHVAKLGSLPPP